MRNLGLILVSFLILLPASAADKARCGVDAFGNVVCMDKDGVLTNAPPKAVAAELADEKGAASGVAAASRDNANRQGKPRCGVDPFGNTVCR